MNHVSQAECRGELEATRAWLDIAERCFRMDARRAAVAVDAEMHMQWRAEQPHRLKGLEHRSRFSRGYRSWLAPYLRLAPAPRRFLFQLRRQPEQRRFIRVFRGEHHADRQAS